MHPIEIERLEIYELLGTYGKPKIGRWVYCKYCYKCVLPIVNYDEGLVQCSECSSGLARLDAVIKAGSYKKWWNELYKDYYERHKDFIEERRKLDEDKSQEFTS